MGWLSGWQYRKSHVINPASGAGTNYQVRVKAHYGTGIDSGENVYLNEHCRSDFGDVRFTDDDGTTLLDYWMESKVDSDYAIFWVEVTDDLSSANATIYIYYGKSDATTTSNGDNTFLFFDHFEGTSLNPSKWTSTGNVAVNNSEVTIWSTSPSLSKIVSTSTWLYVAMRMKIKYADVGDETGGFRTDTSPIDGFIVARLGGFITRTINEDSYTDTSFTGDTDYHIYDLLWKSGQAKCYRDGSLSATHTTNVPDESLNARFATFNPNTQVVVDWLAVRKYVDPEPSHGSWGSEETALILKQWSQTLKTLHALTVIYPGAILKQWLATLQTAHVLRRPLRRIGYTQSVTAVHVLGRPLRVIKFPAPLQLTHVFGRRYRFMKLFGQLGLVHMYYVAVPGVKKTRLFLVVGDLAIQLSSD